MLALKKVAITGSLSSGKSAVGGLFRDLGAYVLDTDEIVHNLIDIPHIQSQLVELLGPQILQDGIVSRQKVAQIVFADYEKLNHLEKILHPLVREEVEKIFKEISKEKKWTLFVVEIPLLFETGSDTFYDATLCVLSDETQCKKRYTHKHPLSTKSYDLRVQRQLSPQEKAQRADFVIHNDGSLEELKEAFSKIYSQIIQ